jgi:hypothetical protein
MTGDEISPYKDFSQKQNGRFLARECPLYPSRARLDARGSCVCRRAAIDRDDAIRRRRGRDATLAARRAHTTEKRHRRLLRVQTTERRLRT